MPMNFGRFTSSPSYSAGGVPGPGPGLVDNQGLIVNRNQFISAGRFVNGGRVESWGAGHFTLEADSSSSGDIVNQGHFTVTGLTFPATLTNTGSLRHELSGSFEVLFDAGVLANSGSVDTAGFFHLTGILDNQTGTTLFPVLGRTNGIADAAGASRRDWPSTNP